MVTPENRLPLFHYLLEIADDHLVLGHRLSEWCGHAPLLEEDIALANLALDCVGVGTLFYEQAAEVEAKQRTADQLAFFRETTEFRNCLLVEQPNGDFAVTIARQFLFDCYACLLFESLTSSSFSPLAAIAAKALKEARYHQRHSSSWVLRLGDGTAESHLRIADAFQRLARFVDELFEASAAAKTLIQEGIISDVSLLRADWDRTVQNVLSEATLADLPADQQYIARGRDGTHSEHLGNLLSVMQSTARAFPGAEW